MDVVKSKKLQVTMDTLGHIVYMEKQLADGTKLPYKKEKGYVKRVNTKGFPIYRVARDVDV